MIASKMMVYVRQRVLSIYLILASFLIVNIIRELDILSK